MGIAASASRFSKLTSTSTFLPVAAVAVGLSGAATSHIVGRAEPVAQVQAAGSTWFDGALEQVAALPNNWDGYGAEAIHYTVIAQIRALLEKLLPAKGLAGSIVPAADGSLQAEWHLAEASFGLIIEEDGAISTWLRKAGREREAHGWQAVDMFSTVARSLLHV